MSSYLSFYQRNKVEEFMSLVHGVLNYAVCFSEAAGSVDSVNGWEAGLSDELASFMKL